MKPFLTLKSVDDVLCGINRIAPLQTEIVSLDQAPLRRIAADFHAPADLPGFDRSTVDGYAAAAHDTFGASETSPALLRCIGESRMGNVPDFTLGPGEVCRILTGGMLPKGADCSVMVEYSRQAGPDLVEIVHSQAPGDNVISRNEDAARGDLLIPAGKLLRPQEIGCLASFGIEYVSVYRKPVVAIISTGDEIVPLDQQPAPGQVHDVNSHSLAALCSEAGAEVHKKGIIGDDRNALENAIRSALDESDTVIVSGGSSAGSRDFTVDAFLALPDSELVAHGVAIRPGKPFILAFSGGKCLAGLPGHVSGALVCGRVFILPILQRLQGAEAPQRIPSLDAILARSIASALGRRDYIRCKLSGSVPEAIPLTSPSGVIAGLVEADGLIICPENCEGFAKGQKVKVELL